MILKELMGYSIPQYYHSRSFVSFPIKQIIRELFYAENTTTTSDLYFNLGPMWLFVAMPCYLAQLYLFGRSFAFTIPCSVRKTNGTKCKYGDDKQLTLYIQINVCASLVSFSNFNSTTQWCALAKREECVFAVLRALQFILHLPNNLLWKC